MRSNLISDVNNYIAYLNNKGFSISVHGKNLCGLLEYNIHQNPFCTFVKTNSAAWNKCIKCQQKIFNISDKEILFGMCYAGIEEYIFFVDSKTFISVSGYGINVKKATNRISNLSKSFHFNEAELLNIYESGLKHIPENIDELKVLIMPLRHMLALLQIIIGDIKESETPSKTFDSILSFVQRNATNDITIRDIAQACACSESTVSHLFKLYMNKSIKKYILETRIKKAKKILLKSDLPITDIALLCGFTNTNYFSTAFKKYVGINPTEYRKERIDI